MNKPTITSVVENIAQLTYKFSDADMDRAWAWQDYDEGVRHAFFRTYEELRELATGLASDRVISTNPVTTVQRILTLYHIAYRDLLAVLVGLTDEQAEQIPAEGEWPLRTIVLHIVGAERAFFTITLCALERARAGDKRPSELSEGEWEAFWAGDPFKELEESGSLSDILAYYDGLHKRILDEFASVLDKELDVRSMFWESTPMPMQFRLHRFDSHLRQHTIQVEKTLVMLDLGPNEARRLLRLVYGALAEVEGILIGARATGSEARQTLTAEIAKRTDEIAAIIAEN